MLKPEDQLNLFKKNAAARDSAEDRQAEGKGLLIYPEKGNKVKAIYENREFVYDLENGSIAEIFCEGSPRKLDKSVLNNLKREIRRQIEEAGGKSPRGGAGGEGLPEDSALKQARSKIEKNWPDRVEIRGREITVNIKGKRVVYEYRGGNSFIAKPLAPASNVLEGEDEEHLQIMLEILKILRKQNAK